MIEQWREYKNDRFPNYEVSNFGRIRNKFSKNIVSLFTSKLGYCIARIHMGQDKRITAFIESLWRLLYPIPTTIRM